MARDGYLWNAGEDTIHQAKKEQVPLTPREKRKNFWYYHRFHILIAILCAAVLGWTIYEFTSRVSPDYQIAFVTVDDYPNTVIRQMEEQISTLAEDRNGDGQVVVRVNYYHMVPEDTADADAYLANAAKFQGDIAMGDSMLYFIDDECLIDYCTGNAGFFTYKDGSTPSHEATDLENLGRKWTEFPFLTNMVLEGQVSTESGGVITTDYQTQLKDINVCMRAVPNSNLEGRADKIKDNEDAWALLHRIEEAS